MNLIADPGFDLGITDWGPLSEAALSLVSEGGHSSPSALKVQAASHSSFEGAATLLSSGFAPGERYQWAPWVKGEAGKRLRVRLEDDAGRNETFFDATGGWQRPTVRRSIDAGASFVQVGVHCGLTQTTSFLVDDVVLDLAPSDFLANWESADPINSEWALSQAIPGRITVVELVLGHGHCGRFEVREGDEEPATGSNRAETQSGLEYQEGQKRWFRIRACVPHSSWDWSHWGLIWQIHDESDESPPLCLMLGEEAGVKKMSLQSGDSKHVYWTTPVPDGRWFELLPVVEFGKEGSVGAIFNDREQLMLNGETTFGGIDTLGKPLAYDKCGIYRSHEALGTAIVFQDEYQVSATPLTSNFSSGVKAVRAAFGGVPKLCPVLRGI